MIRNLYYNFIIPISNYYSKHYITISHFIKIEMKNITNKTHIYLYFTLIKITDFSRIIKFKYTESANHVVSNI